jgi:hypothetical protein
VKVGWVGRDRSARGTASASEFSVSLLNTTRVDEQYSARENLKAS